MAYQYPFIQTMPRRHGRYRDKLLDARLAVPGLTYVAAKSNQVSRVYQVDAALAELRSQAAQHLQLTQEVACSVKTKPPAASSALPTTAA